MELDRERYLAIARERGVNFALTELHRDVNEVEIDMFEGPQGYQPKVIPHLAEIRDFSQQLWSLGREGQLPIDDPTRRPPESASS